MSEDPIIHRDMRDTENHPAVSRTYDDETARLSDSPPGGTVAEQLSDGSMWILNSVGTWISLNGGTLPLSNVKLVDQATSVTIGNDGSTNKPYATVNSGIAALEAGEVTDIKTFLITPYNYSGVEPSITDGVFVGTICIVGLGQLNVAEDLLLPTVPVITKTTGGLSFEGVNALGGSSCPGDLVAYKSNVPAISGGTILVVDSGVSAMSCTDVAGTIISKGCRHNGTISSIGTVINISNARFLNTAVINFTGDPGVVTMDQASYDSAILQGAITITNGVLVTPNTIQELNLSGVGATQNNYNPAGMAQAEIIFIDSGTNVTITGIVPPDPGMGPMRKTFICLSALTMNFAHEDAGSSADNRFHIPGGTRPLNQDESITFYYDRTIGRWRAIGLNGY
jgi:hypothetical protein